MGMVERQPRISKREFISRVASRSGLTVRAVSRVYEAFLEELGDAVASGQTVVLTGFGRFYRQAHKGHKVRFGKLEVDDYHVLKFSASRTINRQLDDEVGSDDDVVLLSDPVHYGMITDEDGIVVDFDLEPTTA